jgi:putative drug exporter of the RND superfamily
MIYYNNMFAHLAQFAFKYRIHITIIWIALAIALVITAPSLAKVGITDDAQFLPKDTESSQAQALLREKFAGAVDEPEGSALIVVLNPDGLTPGDKQAARELHDWLLGSEAPAGIAGVTSVFDNAALQPVLVSRDGTAMLLNLDLSSGSSSAPSRETVRAIRSHIGEQHPGTQIYLTGHAAVATDALTSIQQTIDKATLITIILVIVLLLLIYRSPVAMLVPLITIGVSYLVARGIGGFIAGSGVGVSSLVDAYLVVTLFGIGTDYCLFMVSRFKEELLQNDIKKAGELAIKRIGPVILASATTVIVALLCLGISRFGMNRTSGYILAIGVALTLLAGLTLTPALISLFGRKLLWPAKLQQSQSKAGGFWNRIGRQITRRPVLFVIPILVVLVLPYCALHQTNYSANLLSQMSRDTGAVQGYNVLRDHFATGEMDPLNVVIESGDEDLSGPSSLQDMGDIAVAVAKVDGVSRVLYCATPTEQLQNMGRQSRFIGDNLSPATISQLSFFPTPGQNLQSLAVQYPGVAQSANFQQVVGNLKQISALTGQIQAGAPQDIPGILARIKPLAAGVGAGLEALSAEFNLQVDSPFAGWLRANYYSRDGQAARMEVVLKDDPYSSASIAAVSRVRETLGNAIEALALRGASYYVGGTSADQADILAVNNGDFIRVLALAVFGILLVTILLLRSIVAPLYMITTVIFNFGATLGIAAWLFLDVLKQDAMIYMLPIFVFVILIAVGSDYNIFLVSRIREEAYRRPLKEAICNAVTNTGGVITSCGIILAGTFATLTTASLQMVFQVGAAIGIGVLIDTFLVRALLIPSLAAIAGRWGWWPSGLCKTAENRGNNP